MESFAATGTEQQHIGAVDASADQADLDVRQGNAG